MPMRRGNRGHMGRPHVRRLAGWVTAMAHVKKPREKPGIRSQRKHGPAPSYLSPWLSTELVSAIIPLLGYIK
uniref:Uncharacterized protein n=1 Tax=Oryza punctata TaxID=4537 RepID=A0A0E0K8N2_ORYPU